MIVMERSYRSSDVCRIAGVTFRVLDNWARLEVITPEVREANGSGSRREWSEEQLGYISVMWEVHEYLVRAVGERGVSTDVMHSLALALRERRPWLMGVAVNEEGVVETGGKF